MKINLIAPFSIPGQAEDGSIELPEGMRGGSLFSLGQAPLYTRLLPVSVTGQVVSQQRQLKEGDVMIIIVPVTEG